MNTKNSFRAPNAAGLATPQILCTIIETMSAGLKELSDAGKYTLLTSDQWVLSKIVIKSPSECSMVVFFNNV